MIPKEVIEEIKRRLDIVDVISEYINLERVGRYYRALCPFHTETRPSFYVSPELQRYKCFGCGATGDVIKFVQEMENLSFYEALEKLAERAGIDLSKYRIEESGYSKYISFMEKLKEEYIKELWLSEEALSYMKERGFSEEDLRRFEIGYSPPDSDLPLKVAKKMNIDEKTLLTYGVTTISGKPKDIFEGRIVFPIKNESGGTVAFGGRVIGEGEPKYINSRDTKYFSKSRILFMLDRAKGRIKGADVAIIVEGYMDAYALHRSGLDNSVAVLGTALTPHHASRLSGLTGNVVLAFDSDESGKRAVLKSLSVLIPRGFDILVVEWPEKDADDTLRKLGREGIEKALEDSIPYEEFIVKVTAEKYDLSRVSGLEKFAREIGEWVERISEHVTKARVESLIEKASEVSGIPARDFKRFMKGEVIPEEEIRKFTPEDEVLFLFFNYEDFRQRILSADRGLFGERMRELLELYEREEDLNSALESASKETGDWVFEVLKDFPPPDDPERAFKEAMKRLQMKKLQARLNEIDEMLNEVSGEERRVLLRARMDLMRKMEALKKGGSV